MAYTISINNACGGRTQYALIADVEGVVEILGSEGDNTTNIAGNDSNNTNDGSTSSRSSNQEGRDPNSVDVWPVVIATRMAYPEHTVEIQFGRGEFGMLGFVRGGGEGDMEIGVGERGRRSGGTNGTGGREAREVEEEIGVNSRFVICSSAGRIGSSIAMGSQGGFMRFVDDGGGGGGEEERKHRGVTDANAPGDSIRIRIDESFSMNGGVDEKSWVTGLAHQSEEGQNFVYAFKPKAQTSYRMKQPRIFWVVRGMYHVGRPVDIEKIREIGCKVGFGNGVSSVGIWQDVDGVLRRV